MKFNGIVDSNVMYISQFGSYGTEEWIDGISDIDIGVIVNSLSNLDYSLEDKLVEYFKEQYKYNIVNITIVEYDLDNKLTRNIICGKTIYSSLDEKYIKKKCVYIEKSVAGQRNYYEMSRLKLLKSEVNNIW
ncbi:MAG: nucleotidyltransferase domain-containing protein [Clostridium sp.]